MTPQSGICPRKVGNVKSVRVRTNGAEHLFRGRYAWTLLRLLTAGELGCTPLEQPAPRWSEYVAGLRRAGISVETIWEQHGGTYSGRHGRYVLRSPVEVIETQEAA